MSKKEKLSAPRGTYDLHTTDMNLRHNVVNSIFDLCTTFGFEQIQTPIFERTDLFNRAVGIDTDVVSKEMYNFEDKKGRQMSLRPELTAPIVRSYIENKFYATHPIAKFSYFGPAFRYERPQAGRFRQFHQFGVECFGLKNPSLDAEIITLAMSVLKVFGIEDKVVLKINTLGSAKERSVYIDALKSHFNNHIDELCEDCQTRLDTNPLRVLDCKIDCKKQFFKDAPLLMNYLEQDTKVYFNKVLDILEKQNLNYEVDNLLVRGLDYYNDIVFEIVCDNGKAQNTIIGGGRYDNLVEQLGGPATPGFGFALGIERLIDLIKELNSGIENEYAKSCEIVYMPLCEEAIDMSIISMNKLRIEGIRCETSYEVKSLKANFKQADRLNAVYAIIIGEDEIKNDIIIVKNLQTKEETKISLSEFEDDIIKGDEHEKH